MVHYLLYFIFNSNLKQLIIQARLTVAVCNAVLCKGTEHVQYSDATGQFIQTNHLLPQFNHKLWQDSVHHHQITLVSKLASNSKILSHSNLCDASPRLKYESDLSVCFWGHGLEWWRLGLAFGYNDYLIVDIWYLVVIWTHSISDS